LEERGITWEAVTAMSLILSGAGLLIMRHPKAVQATENVIDELM